MDLGCGSPKSKQELATMTRRGLRERWTVNPGCGTAIVRRLYSLVECRQDICIINILLISLRGRSRMVVRAEERRKSVAWKNGMIGWMAPDV